VPDSGDHRPAVPETRGLESTYRLQLTGDFGFAAAADLAGYLERLGVTHAYLSPVLRAAPGSTHGYDVTDHSLVSPELGGEDGFRAMVTRFQEHDLGVIVDVVPNHMAIQLPENRLLWSVLAGGPDSEYAHWFDIDWPANDGRFLLPILSNPADDCFGELAVSDGTLRYHDHMLPLRPGTERLPIRDLLAAQHYELAYWRDASTRLNWRRFFDITSLIGIRQENPDVFAATHEVLLRLMAEGFIDGLRIDHPDGLADPRGYFRQLATATKGAWVVAEKILARDEELPRDWPCAGTTGYDALGRVDGLFVDPAGAAPLTELYQSFTGTTAKPFAEVAETAKREVATRTFTPELNRLAKLFDGHHGEDVRTVLVEMLAAFGVYRAYVHPGEPVPKASVEQIAAASTAAKRKLPQHLHATLDALSAALPGDGPAELITRFQQTTGPVLAKGVEDTACYRWSRLISLNEVGADPDRFGVSPAEFHDTMRRRIRDWPRTLTTLSTHDTKRAEDVRARLAVLAEIPDEWAAEVAAWHRAAAGGAANPGIDPDTEYLIWQTLAGAWPISQDRLAEYLTKAVREAKTRTSWSDPDPDYEARVLDLAHRAPADRIAQFADEIAPDARVNTLGAKLVQLTMPGVADVYQGCELTSYALVDPDNRRPVDFGRRRAMLTGHHDSTDLDAEKLLVTSRALRLRRDHPDWFTEGRYVPLAAEGPAVGHVVAFQRGAAITVATRLPVGLRRRGGWADTRLPLAGPWHDVLTGAPVAGITLEELTKRRPVALLIPAELAGPA
jgi:(1->4)-alpha-D-glucan 1-alpha-D-glucosylmutase